MIQKPRYYILAGEKQNWQVSINNKVWGFSESTKGSWNKIQSGEMVAFYVTSPIKKIIGFGRVKEKFVDKSILWSDDEFFGRAMWPYRISLEIIHVIKNWDKDGIQLPPNLLIQVSRKVISKELYYALIKNSEKQWKIKISIVK